MQRILKPFVRIECQEILVLFTPLIVIPVIIFPWELQNGLTLWERYLESSSQSYRFNPMVHSLFVYFFIILITSFDYLITHVALASLFGRLGFDAHGGTTVIL